MDWFLHIMSIAFGGHGFGAVSSIFFGHKVLLVDGVENWPVSGVNRQRPSQPCVHMDVFNLLKKLMMCFHKRAKGQYL